MGQTSGTSEGPDFGIIGGILITLIILYLVSALFSFIQGMVMTRISNNVTWQNA